MTTVDLKKYINSENKIGYVLEQAGFQKVKEHDNYYTAMNPTGDNPTALNIRKVDYLPYVNYTRGVSADDKQDIINAVEYARNCNFITALKWIHEILDIPFTLKKPQKQKMSQRDEVLNIFKRYKVNRSICNVEDIKLLDQKDMMDIVPLIHIDIFREGITPKAIKDFGLGYSYKYHRTVFPHYYWQSGEIIGLNERTSIKDYEILGIKKYYLTKGFNKSINLYGLWQNRAEIEKKHIIVLMESEKSVVKRYSRGDGTVVGLSGHSLSHEQVRIILGLNINEVVIALDKDIDIAEIFSLCEKIYPIKKVSFILDKNNLLGEKDSPADADNQIYQELFKNRIMYSKKLHNLFLKKQA